MAAVDRRGTRVLRPIDRPCLIGACCEVRVWDVCVSKSLDVGHLTPMHPHELWPDWLIVWCPSCVQPNSSQPKQRRVRSGS